MGFFENLGLWIWEGIVLNIIYGAIAFTVIVLAWAALYGALLTLTQNRTYRGLLTTDDDNPASVVAFCLFAPVLIVGLIGFLFGLLFSSLMFFILFFGNLIPFLTWGRTNASVHFENLTMLYIAPIEAYKFVYYLLMAFPLVSIVISLVAVFAFMGYLIPHGDNTGVSLSNSNSQTAALSLSVFLAVFAVMLIMGFSPLSGHLHSIEMEGYSEENKAEYGDSYPSFGYQSSEGYETKRAKIDESYDYNLLNIPFYSEIYNDYDEGFTGELESQSDGVISCLSLNTISDDVDAFKVDSQLGDNYHVSVISTHKLNVSVVTESYYYGDLRSYPTDLTSEFHTSIFMPYSDFSNDIVGFDLSIGEEWDGFKAAKYHVVYAYAPDGITNQTNETIAELTANLTDPSTCDRYALSISGPLEPRVRLSFLSYVFAGAFLLGCIIQRYFVILGHDGVTESRILFRTFVQSQMIAIGFFGLIIFLFDPLDGMGITGLRLDEIIQTTIFASKVAILIFLLVVALIGGVALYSQRHNIGDATKALIESETERARINEEWFSSD